MSLLTNDHGDFWCAEHAIGFHIPPCLRQHGMARGSQAGEIRHRRASYETHTCFGWQAEQVAQPAQRDLL